MKYYHRQKHILKTDKEPNGRKCFYLSINDKCGNKLVIKQLPINGVKQVTYIINGVKKKKKVKAEEIEGIYRDDKKIYFTHKVEYKDYEKIQTIESIAQADLLFACAMFCNTDVMGRKRVQDLRKHSLSEREVGQLCQQDVVGLSQMFYTISKTN